MVRIRLAQASDAVGAREKGAILNLCILNLGQEFGNPQEVACPSFTFLTLPLQGSHKRQSNLYAGKIQGIKFLRERNVTHLSKIL